MPDFQSLFDCFSDVVAEAPGRVNLIGEHTDYNGGFVLPSAIPQRTRVELKARPDCRVLAWSANIPGAEDPLAYMLGEEKAGRGWLDYIQGITSVLRTEGQSIGGFNLRIESSVPPGSGLGSSAALEVSLLRGLRSSFGLRLDDLQLALLGQRAERELVGAQVGIMDQLAASLADESSALFIDTRSLDYEKIPLPAGLDIVVIHSGVSHSHASGQYNARRAECEHACELLQVRQLRQLTPADLARTAELPQPLGRRVRHVVTENERVLLAVNAVREADLERLGELLYASHQSLRDDYEVSVPELDLLVELGRAEPDVYGARLTGGGFGGSVIVLTRTGAGANVARRIVTAYDRETGRTASVLLPVIR